MPKIYKKNYRKNFTTEEIQEMIWMRDCLKFKPNNRPLSFSDIAVKFHTCPKIVKQVYFKYTR